MCHILDFLLLTKPLPSFLLRNVAGCSYVTLQGTELSILTSHSVFSKMATSQEFHLVMFYLLLFVTDSKECCTHFHAGVNIRAVLPGQK